MRTCWAGAEKKMSRASLYEILGIPKERADEIARIVRETFSESKTPGEWIARLVAVFGVDENNAEIFACAWFAGKYAGVSEVFNRVQKEIDIMERDEAERREKESHYPQPDGYA